MLTRVPFRNAPLGVSTRNVPPTFSDRLMVPSNLTSPAFRLNAWAPWAVTLSAFTLSALLASRAISLAFKVCRLLTATVWLSSKTSTTSCLTFWFSFLSISSN